MAALDCEETLVLVLVMVILSGLGLMEWPEGHLSAWGF